MAAPPGFVLAELQRLLANIIRWGVVTGVDYDPPRCKVKTAGVETDWLPWPAQAAGETSSWEPIEPGEMVLLAAPNGELAKAAVIARFHSSKKPPADNQAPRRGRRYQDGSSIFYDEQSHTLSADLVDAQLTATREQVTCTRGQATVSVNNDVILAEVGGGSINVTDSAIMAEVGGGSINVTDSAIVFTVAGQTVAINSGGIFHNGTQIGLLHTHDDVTPGIGISGTVS